MLRKAIAAKTPMGIRAKEQVEKGKLVGDDIVIGIIKENLFKPACSKGFVLDGFPRNIEQARALNELLEEQNVKLDSVLEMTILEDKLMDRVCGRRIHPKSGRTYLCSNPSYEKYHSHTHSNTAHSNITETYLALRARTQNRHISLRVQSSS